MATFIKIGTKATVALVLAVAVFVWAMIAPASLQATVNTAIEFVGELIPTAVWWQI